VRALQYDRYGGVDQLILREVPRPAARGGPLVRVAAAALNPKDALFRKGKFRLLSGRRFPKGCGLDFAGHVEVAGAGLAVGQRVFGMIDEFAFTRGTLADVVAVRPEEVCALPEGVALADAAAVALVSLTALQALRDVARVRTGARVLVNGASGGVGTVAIQIARALGAHVTTISSAGTAELCTQLGAERTLDYAGRDVALQSGDYDVVFDVFGSLTFAQARGALDRRRGVFVSTVPSASRVLRDVLLRWGSHVERLVVVHPRRADLETLAGWLSSGVLRAVIDTRLPLERYAEAFARLESKHTHGKIVLEVGA
jgi:NADPH:quinone reductase-like Zn-dependent oxidoreductase